MQTTLTHDEAAVRDLNDLPTPDVVETRVWSQEHAWLYALLHSDANVAPTFRLPDLLSACVALVFDDHAATQQIFRFLGTELVLRDPATPRRRESLWRPQYELLHDLQCSAANRHPYPKFQLDQITTACVALCRQQDETGAAVLLRARHNMVDRLVGRQRPGTTPH
jgi:hypothetical protein